MPQQNIINSPTSSSGMIPYTSSTLAMAVYVPGTPILSLLGSSSGYNMVNGGLFYTFHATIPIN